MGLYDRLTPGDQNNIDEQKEQVEEEQQSAEEEFVDRYNNDTSTDNSSSDSSDNTSEATEDFLDDYGPSGDGSFGSDDLDSVNDSTDNSTDSSDNATPEEEFVKNYGQSSKKKDKKKKKGSSSENPLVDELQRQRNVIDSEEADMNLENPSALGPQTVTRLGTGNIPPAQISNEEYRSPEQTVVDREYGSGTNLKGQSYLNQDQTAEDVTAKSLIQGAQDVMIDPGQTGQNTYESVSNLDLPGEMEETYAKGAGTITAAGAQLFNTVPSIFQTTVAASQNPSGTASKLYQGTKRAGPNLEGLSRNTGSKEYFESQAGILNLVAGAGASSLARKGSLRGVTTDEGLTDLVKNPVRPGDDATVEAEIQETFQSKPDQLSPEAQKALSQMDLSGTKGPAGSGRRLVVEGDGENTYAEKQDYLMTKVQQNGREFIVVGRTASQGRGSDGESEGLVASESLIISENGELVDQSKQKPTKKLYDFQTEVTDSSQDVVEGVGPRGDEKIVKTDSVGEGTVAGEDFIFRDESQRFSSPGTDADLLQSKSVTGTDNSKSSIGSKGPVINRGLFEDEDVKTADIDGESTDFDAEKLQDSIESIFDDQDSDRSEVGNVIDRDSDGQSDSDSGPQKLKIESSNKQEDRTGIGTDAVNQKAFEENVKDAASFEDTGADSVFGPTEAAVGTNVLGEAGSSLSQGQDQDTFGLVDKEDSQQKGRDKILEDDKTRGKPDVANKNALDVGQDVGQGQDFDTNLDSSQETDSILVRGLTNTDTNFREGDGNKRRDLNLEGDDDDDKRLFSRLLGGKKKTKYRGSVGAEVLGITAEEAPGRSAAQNPLNLRPVVEDSTKKDEENIL
ncbi:hypothetical protein [Candidatus Nanohalovita haloferacivicina]|uniref:hypothetical protein n=1 Tax=Candidatus Nanohalovita haloferacivicina TaxID=2978046 RepID=UPI00325FDDF4|nr:hypothetical protein HBNXNv_0351 [Candidatus Nanohalobia archaeon BNXNv]